MATVDELFSATDALGDLPDVCRRFAVRRLDLFGSAATGNGFDPLRSDLDLLVTFEPMEPGDYARAWFGLREALEALAGRPIDLVTESAIKNPYFRERVEAERRPLYPEP